MTRERLIAEYTTIGMACVGLDWATARRVAREIVDARSNERPVDDAAK